MSTRTTFSLKREVTLQGRQTHTGRQKGRCLQREAGPAGQGRARESCRPGHLRSPHTARVGGSSHAKHRVGMVSGTAIATFTYLIFVSPVDKVHLGFLSFTARLVFQPSLRDRPGVSAESSPSTVHRGVRLPCSRPAAEANVQPHTQLEPWGQLQSASENQEL